VIEVFENQRVFFGQEGSGQFLQDTLAGWGAKKLLFITGKGSFRESGAEAFLDEALLSGFENRFSDFSTNPTLADLKQGLACFDAVKPDCIVAVGGGSVLDMAKLVNFFGSLDVDPEAYLDKRAEGNAGSNLVRLVALPTTSGTGSETTHFSVLYRGKVKYSVADPRMVPDAVVLNPALTTKLSPYQTACTGIDALAQGIESYWAVGSTKESRRWAEKAIQLAWDNLEQAVAAPDGESRRKMQEAAYWAGRAIDVSKTTAAHAMSYALTAHYGMPHGHAVALALPAVLLANASVTDQDVNDARGADYVRSTTADLCRLLGEEEPAAASQRLQELIAGIGLSDAWLSEHGFDPAQARKRVVQEVNPERLKNNPRQLGMESLLEISARIK
jgi:alcohol dehydrogenase class IV